MVAYLAGVFGENVHHLVRDEIGQFSVAQVKLRDELLAEQQPAAGHCSGVFVTAAAGMELPADRHGFRQFVCCSRAQARQYALQPFKQCGIAVEQFLVRQLLQAPDVGAGGDAFHCLRHEGEILADVDQRLRAGQARQAAGGTTAATGTPSQALPV